jgi:hypothetical protein
MPAYPNTVPHLPDLSSFDIARYLPPLRTEMEGGNTRARKRPGDDVATISQSIPMTTAQWGTLLTFVKTTLVNGTARFTMDVWDGIQCQEDRTVMLAGEPKPTRLGAGKVLVSFPIRVYDLA